MFECNVEIQTKFGGAFALTPSAPSGHLPRKTGEEKAYGVSSTALRGRWPKHSEGRRGPNWSNGLYLNKAYYNNLEHNELT